jgi:ABC-type uncharacterized transport system auxiliary subunit
MTRRWWLLSLVVVAACAIARTPPSMTWYLLTVPGERIVMPVPVRVGSFSAEQAYASSRLAYRTSPYELDYYLYHRWAAQPRSLVGQAVRATLVSPPGTENETALVVEGVVRRLEAVEDGPNASGALTLALVASRGADVVVDEVYEEQVPATSRKPKDIAEALSAALRRVLERFRDDVAAAVRR